MKHILTILAIIFASLCANAQRDDFWKVMNKPEGGSSPTMAVNSAGELFMANGNGLHKSSDGGATWANLGFEGSSILSVEVNELGDILLGVKLIPHFIYKSVDTGKTWYGVWDAIGNPIDIDSHSGGLVFGSSGTGSYRSAIRSTDHGESWEEVKTFPSNTEYPYDFAFLNTDTIYMGTTNWMGGGGVYMFTEGGDICRHIGLTDFYVSSVALNPAGDLFAGSRGNHYLGQGGVHVLPKGATEWVWLKDDNLVSSIVITPEGKIFVSCTYSTAPYGGVWYSADNGETWEDISASGMHYQDIETLILDNEGYLYAAASSLDNIWYRSVNPTIGKGELGKPGGGIRLRNYPNPFKGSTTIEFEAAAEKPVNAQLLIYNSMGRLIASYAFEAYRGQEETKTFDATNLPAGIYFCQLRAGSTLATHKMILKK